MNVNQLIYSTLRKAAKAFSGHGLRGRFKAIDRAYKSINRKLAPSVAEVHGHAMYLDRDDSMALAVNGLYEPTETDLILGLIQSGHVVLDIGANIGYYTLLFAGIVGDTGHIFAFEPDPYSFELLSKNISVNRFSNVSAFQLAVADRDAELPLYQDKFSNLDHRLFKPSSESASVMVKAVKLDSFLPQILDRRIDFVKMDIQGAEGLALEGMKGLVAQSSTVTILAEYWPKGLDQSGYGGANFLRQLTSLGFEFLDLGDENNRFKQATVEELTLRYPAGLPGHTNLLCRRPLGSQPFAFQSMNEIG